MNRNFNKHLVCPVCNKGEVLANRRAKVTISVSCPKCGNFFWADLYTLKTEKAAAQKKMSRTG